MYIKATMSNKKTTYFMWLFPNKVKPCQNTSTYKKPNPHSHIKYECGRNDEMNENSEERTGYEAPEDYLGETVTWGRV
jgi:hypothetical protein